MIVYQNFIVCKCLLRVPVAIPTISPQYWYCHILSKILWYLILLVSPSPTFETISYKPDFDVGQISCTPKWDLCFLDMIEHRLLWTWMMSGVSVVVQGNLFSYLSVAAARWIPVILHPAPSCWQPFCGNFAFRKGRPCSKYSLLGVHVLILFGFYFNFRVPRRAGYYNLWMEEHHFSFIHPCHSAFRLNQ